MSRTARYFKSLGSNYLLLFAGTLYTLASVPIALRYLGTEEFGVWIATCQIAGFLLMIDLGTSSAGIRLLIDHKDTPNSGPYGSLIKATVAVQSAQALIILLVGIGLVPVLAGWLKVPGPLIHSFNVLWLWQIGLLAFNFPVRIAAQLLNAHQRLDVVNYSQLAGVGASFAGMLGAFALNAGIYSFAFGQTLSALVVVVWTIVASLRLRLFPVTWGPLTRNAFHNLFGFGSEVFLVTLGTQFINASQTFLLSRLLGFEAVSIWSVMTKLFSLLTQLVWRIIGVAMLAFSEMLVREEHESLWRRYRSIFDIAVLASCFCGVLIGFGNSAFVDVWTHGRIHWNPLNDWLLALWFVLLTQVCAHNGLILSTKRLQAVKFIYFFEGAIFIAASLLVIPRAGISGMLICSIICTSLFTLTYGTRRVAALLQSSGWKMAFGWLAPAVRFISIVLPIGVALALLTTGSPMLRLLGCVLPLSLLGALIAVRFCLSTDLRLEIISRVPRWSRHPVELIIGPDLSQSAKRRA